MTVVLHFLALVTGSLSSVQPLSRLRKLLTYV